MARPAFNPWHPPSSNPWRHPARHRATLERHSETSKAGYLKNPEATRSVNGQTAGLNVRNTHKTRLSLNHHVFKEPRYNPAVERAIMTCDAIMSNAPATSIAMVMLLFLVLCFLAIDDLRTA